MSRATKRLLDHLRWREAMGTCYLAQAGRGRFVLVVPELRNGGPLARVDAFNGRTVDDAETAGLVTIGADRESHEYRGRRHLEGRADRTIALTDTGRDWKEDKR